MPKPMTPKQRAALRKAQLASARKRRGTGKGSKAAAKQRYRYERKANARAHRARVKGSVKARASETTELRSRRGRTLAGGAALVAIGHASNSHTAKRAGKEMLKRGAVDSATRTLQTRGMSKGLQRSRNKAAKSRYYKATGKSRHKQALKKAAAAGVVAGVVYTAHKRGNISGYAGKDGVTLKMHNKTRTRGVSLDHTVLGGGVAHEFSARKYGGKSPAIHTVTVERGKRPRRDTYRY